MSGRAAQRALRLIPAAAEALSSRSGLAVWSVLPLPRTTLQCTLAWHSRCYSSLSELLKKELSYEESSSQESAGENALQNVPQGWSLSAADNDTTLVLSKQQGGQDIDVKVSVLGQEEANEEGEEAEDSGPEYALNFQLNCIKGSETLRFSLLYVENDTEGPEIEHVSILPQGIKDEEEADFYTGPSFAELEEQVQEQFGEFVAKCGVDAELCQYLCRLVYDKEQQLYTEWLRKAEKFVRAS